MPPRFVVDVGNTRIKWGRVAADRVAEVAALPPDDPAAWQAQAERWAIPGDAAWLLAGVNPQALDRLRQWLYARHAAVGHLHSYHQLPLTVAVDFPEQVGMDRLLNAVAANTRRPAGVPAVVVDCGSAVTVNWVDEGGAFRGGAIFPGLRLMAQALHAFTAKLPLIDHRQPPPPVPGTSTVAAMSAGVHGAVAGGIRLLAEQLARPAPAPPACFLTGGDAPLVAAALGPAWAVWPAMTLEGLRAAGAAAASPP